MNPWCFGKVILYFTSASRKRNIRPLLVDCLFMVICHIWGRQSHFDAFKLFIFSKFWELGVKRKETSRLIYSKTNFLKNNQIITASLHLDIQYVFTMNKLSTNNGLSIYGVKFYKLYESDRLILHSFIYSVVCHTHTFQLSCFEWGTPVLRGCRRLPIWSQNLLFWGKHLQTFNFFKKFQYLSQVTSSFGVLTA